MRFWASASALTRRCSGRFPKRALFFLFLASTFASAQTTQKPATKKTTARRVNELTLAGLRPGKDNLARAAELNKRFGNRKELPGGQTAWFDACRDSSLTVDSDKEKRIQVIRVGFYCCSTVDCEGPPGPWKTGRGLRVGDAAAKVAQLYGEPDSRSPSTKDGQPLELWYYAFDWAGPDVPQVMEVLCTKEKDGQPGRVVEITLAAPSL
jgi:hypothetical protein